MNGHGQGSVYVGAGNPPGRCDERTDLRTERSLRYGSF